MLRYRKVFRSHSTCCAVTVYITKIAGQLVAKKKNGGDWRVVTSNTVDEIVRGDLESGDLIKDEVPQAVELICTLKIENGRRAKWVWQQRGANLTHFNRNFKTLADYDFETNTLGIKFVSMASNGDVREGQGC